MVASLFSTLNRQMKVLAKYECCCAKWQKNNKHVAAEYACWQAYSDLTWFIIQNNNGKKTEKKY